MKFVHLADLHIGKKLAGYSLLEDQRYIFEQILKETEHFKPDAVLIAGDVYDRAIPSEEAIKLYEFFITALSEICPVYMISGNHDSGARLSLFSEVLKEKNIHIVGTYSGKIERENLALGDEEVEFFMLPYFTPQEIRRFLEEDQEIHTYEDALIQILEKEQIDPEKLNILLTHQFYLNSHEDYDRSLEGSERPVIGGLDDIHSKHLKDFDYSALGHIHGMREVGAPNIRYPGTPLKYSLNEHDKYLNCITLTKDRLDIAKIPLKPLRDVVTIEGGFDELIKGEGSEDYVFINLTDQTERENIKKRLLNLYPNLLGIGFEHLGRVDLITGVDEQMVKESPIDLLENFYRQKDKTLSLEARAEAEKIFKEILEESK